ncbi:AraC family transcriptional regulator [Gorillibacterium timonense]|uniref:AraC family transcriptional regulator n=1 Tax=Gorillibacterium timonense TaxID=1689269 RepID=UPI00071D6AAD|nr:AraC family transcriptional regulator [Gorillibacterium timonense]
MDHQLLETINETTDFIETHLLEDLNLDRIADHVSLSKFHLLRIWKGATSTGLMEYVRRRRIAQSLGDLIHDRTSIDFISSKYSFGCERTYTRAFKDEFNTSPSKWRRNPIPLQILDRFNANFLQIAGDGLIFFRSITVRPPFSIAGLEFTVDERDNRENQTANRLGVDFFYNSRPRIINPVDKDTYIGYTTVPSPFEGFTFYQPSVQVNAASIIPPDMNKKQLRAYKYGVFTYMGSHRPEDITSRSLEGIWAYVSDVWMPTVEIDLKECFHFESINYAKCSKHYCECDLYYPITAL